MGNKDETHSKSAQGPNLRGLARQGAERDGLEGLGNVDVVAGRALEEELGTFVSAPVQRTRGRHLTRQTDALISKTLNTITFA